ncbi:hypothetical protein MNBD_BACTEROID05-716 [hydrothermal vent metagenome]|uniref:Toxin n=1 Tax=hydrothermal vent metagenome TaxID=652676 RepID=A0A3B0TXP6_9ZZZZ
MKKIEWNNDKNLFLKKERNISFEEVVVKIENDDVLDILKHPNSKKYPNQKIFIIFLNKYIYLVPFVEDNDKIFIKTIIPSSKYTKIYLNKQHEDGKK